MCAANRLQVIKNHLTEGNGSFKQGSQKSYRFTLDKGILTDSERVFYEENGFLVVRNLVPHEALDTYAQRFRDICNGRVDRGRISLVKDVSLMSTGAKGEHLYNKIQDFMWDDVFFDYCSRPEIVRVVESITGPNIMTIHTMLINKPPDAGTATSRHPLHQDLYYFPFRPADKIVCSWTAMEKVTRENGCLVVLPGTHRGRLHIHDYPEWENGVNKMYHGIPRMESLNRVHLEMEKGDTVFFHPVLIHGSGSNKTKGFRKAISSHYAASECNYIEVRGTIQENIAKEVEEISQKRGTPLEYHDIWKLRARLVKGETKTL